MKKVLMILSMVLLLCFTFGCETGDEVDIQAETEAVRAAHMAMEEAGPAKDVDLFLSFLADEVIRPGSPHQDTAAIREFYTNWFANGSYWINRSLDKIEVSASGDFAYTVYTFEHFREVEGETTFGLGGDFMVWKKQGDGSWKIVAF
ncbi:YybH family protein [Acidobacteriota bacterium]